MSNQTSLMNELGNLEEFLKEAVQWETNCASHAAAFNIRTISEIGVDFLIPSGRHAEIMTRHCLEGEHLKDIASDLGISAVRAGQLHQAALRSLCIGIVKKARGYQRPFPVALDEDSIKDGLN